MKVERNSEEIIIRVAADTDLTGIQQVLDYARFREIASKSKATQDQIDQMAEESKASWWRDHKSQFVG